MVKSPDFGAAGTRFDPRQQHLLSCHNLLRGGAVTMVTDSLKLTVETQEVKADYKISVGHCVIPFGKGLLPLWQTLLSR